MRIIHAFSIVVLSGALAACAPMNTSVAPMTSGATSQAAIAQPSGRGPVLGKGTTAAAYDRTSQAEKEAALAVTASAGERSLGKVPVSLGSPTEQGIWLKSPLVKTAGKGRVVTAAGKSAAVDLLPGSGATQLSLAAYLALGLSLTALPEVQVYAN